MQLKTAIILILGIPGDCIICYFCGKYELEMTCAKGIEKAWNITCDKGDVCGVILLQNGGAHRGCASRRHLRKKCFEEEVECGTCNVDFCNKEPAKQFVYYNEIDANKANEIHTNQVSKHILLCTLFYLNMEY